MGTVLVSTFDAEAFPDGTFQCLLFWRQNSERRQQQSPA